jgi:hypothetical protein
MVTRRRTAALALIFALQFVVASAAPSEVSKNSTVSDPDSCPDPQKTFAGEAPVADADPTVRHEETIQVPTRLVFPRSHPRWPVLSYDSTSVQSVILSVGYKMTLGVKTRLYYHDGVRAIELGTGVKDIGCLMCGGRVLHGVTDVMKRQGSAQVVVEFVIFETDIPGQHLWQPERGRYQELWRGLATGVVAPER